MTLDLDTWLSYKSDLIHWPKNKLLSIAEVLEPFSHKSDAKDNFPLQNFQRNVNGPFNRMSLTNSETGNSNPLANLNQISSGFGQNPWDFDVQPDEDFVRQVS